MVYDKSKHHNQSNETSEGKSQNKSEEEDMGDLDHTSRCRMKLLCELELLRQYGCQEKISSVVVGVQQASLYATKEKLIRQETIWRANHAKHLQDEQEMYRQLHEDELEARKRQEQIAYEHEQHAKRVQEINQMIQEVERKQKEAEEEERKKLIEKKTHIDQCHSYVSEYRSNYEKIVEILKTCKDNQALVASISSTVSRLKLLSDLMDNQIPEKCRNGTIRTEDVEGSYKAVEEAKNMTKHFQEEVDRINREYEQSVLEQKQKASAVAPALGAASALSTPVPSAQLHGSQPVPEGKEPRAPSVLNEFVDKDAFKAYSSLKTFHEEFSKSYEGLVKDERMKQFKFDCQKAVNIPVNAIAPTSASHLQDKLTKLHGLLSGQSVEVGRARFSAAQHPHGIAFCKDLLARKFVGQGETTVSSKPEAAFAIAAVAVALWVDFPDFGQLLLAHFYKECPYLVPIFMPQVEGQSDVEYYKSLGYRYTESGEVEKQDKFLKRMSGIMHLYCAIIVTPLKRSFSRPHPLGLGEAWRWLACLVNMDPRPDVCATLLYDYLEVTGRFMFRYYGPMFQKMLHLLCTEYFPKMEKVTPTESRGPVARLESFLQKILKEGGIRHPVGLLPPNFW